MSSHHIVRDQQEPAVFIHSIEHFPIPVLNALLEWSPTVLCYEPSIDRYTQQGLKLDVALVSHFTYEFWKKKLEKQYPFKIFATSDSELLMTVLTMLRKDNHKAVNIVSDKSALFEVVEQCMRWAQDLDIVIHTETHRHIVHKSLVFKKWLPAFSNINVRPLTDQSFFSTSGFEKNMDNEWRKDEVELIKKEEGEVVIMSSKSPFLISEHL